MTSLKHNIQKNVSLKKHTTFKVGGKADFFVKVDDLQRLKNVLKWAQEHQQKIFILGGGSNLLFVDEGFAGLVIKVNHRRLEAKIKGDRAEIICGAGNSLSKVVAMAFKNNLTGLSWAIGIPGTIGGAVRGNAGAFGGEMKDIVNTVRALNIKCCKMTKYSYVDVVIQPNELVKHIGENYENIKQDFTNDDCHFKYRSSIFKEFSNLIIWEIKIKLTVGAIEKNKKIAREYLKQRRTKQPEITKYPSAGSIFKNPKVPEEIQEKFKYDTETESKNGKVPAGWLISRCELLGKRIGDAMISEKHGNFIINMGDATASDILLLISIAKTTVRNKYGVQLQEEICIVC